ncbi:MAG: ABC transporter permease subunit [bacterium]|nr:ABC transporter permease subunit [bacterium]
MKNMLTIFRRDLASYFKSPVGYIFMIVFLLISVGLYITSFFTFPMADMRGYFANLPILMCVFIPAVTMRVWAEERKENTWEMLLTFPMRGRELVLGKFFATVVFFALTLLATISVPIMLAWLGNPDNGTILSGYLGTLLLGAFFLSIGIFFSGLCKDQIVAFVVTLLACFAVFLLGTNFIAAFIDDAVPGLGSLLSQLVGMMDHYGSFTRGVIEVGDVLYFVAWTSLFLVLNSLYIEGRQRPGVRVTFSMAVVMCLAIGLAFNWLLTGTSIKRWDMTEDKIYTVSDASGRILAKLKSPVQIKLYITPKGEMPTGLKQFEQDVSAKVQELGLASNGKIQFSVIPMNASNALSEDYNAFGEEEEKEGEEKDEVKTLEQRMLEKGVRPFTVQDRQQDQVTTQLIYAALGVAYRDKEEEFIPQLMPQLLPELEYRLVNTIYKLALEEKAKVALFAPQDAVNISPQMRQIYAQMGQPIPQSEDPYEMVEMLLRQEKYEVERVTVAQDSPLPEEYSSLVILNPRELSDRQKWEINRALVSGKSVILAVQNAEWGYQFPQNGLVVSKRDENPQANDLLEQYGLGVDDSILFDVNHVPLSVRTGNNPLEMLTGGSPIDLPFHILLKASSMAQSMPMTQRLSEIFYLWGSALTIDEETLAKYGLNAEVVMHTTERAWKAPTADRLSQDMITPPEGEGQKYPIMAVISGQFPDAYKDAPRPAWPPAQPAGPGMPPPPPPEEEGEAEPVTPAPGKLILIGGAQMFRKDFLPQGSNADLFMNCIDSVTLGEDLVDVRGRKPINRAIDRPTDGQRAWWKFVNYVLMSGIIAAAGIVIAVARKRGRNAYAVKYAAGE